MKFDAHVHTNYSDGDMIHRMVNAAERAGVEKLGLADHCNVLTGQGMERSRLVLGFNLDITYQRRRRAIEMIQERTDVNLFDAAEMDYEPEDEERIAEFVDEAGFDYLIGSVHYLEGANIHYVDRFKQLEEEELHRLVDHYFEKLVSLVRSGIVDIAAHIDLVERNPHLRGKATTSQYEKVAKAFRSSDTLPELNAGRSLHGLEAVHPLPEFRRILVTEEIPFTLGTDSHAGREIVDRTKHLRKLLEDFDGEIVEPPFE